MSTRLRSWPAVSIKSALVVKANKFSAAAKAKIEAAGGKAEEVGRWPRSKLDRDCCRP